MDERIKRTFQVIIPLGAFLGFIVYSLFYVWTVPGDGILCPCTVPVSTIVVSVALTGLFVGSFMHYIISKSFTEKKEYVEEGAEKILKFLDGDTRKIVRALVGNNGEMLQSDITKKTGLSRVKVSRTVKELSQMGLVEKTNSGVSNRIKLDEELYSLLSKSK